MKLSDLGIELNSFVVMRTIDGTISLELSDEHRQAIEEQLDDPEIEPRMHRRLMTARFHGLRAPHLSIA